MLADRVADHLGHAGGQIADADGGRRERLAAREGQQPPRERRGAVDALIRRVEIALHVGAALREALVQQMQAALDDGEQVVEIVRHAAGELADRFHLLALAQRFFRLFAFLHLGLEAAVGVGQHHGAILQLEIDGAQGALRRRHHGQEQRRHDRQQHDRGIARQPPLRRFVDGAEIDGAERQRGLADRREDGQTSALLHGARPRQRARHRPLRVLGESREQPALGIVDGDRLDLRIDAQGGDVFARRLHVAERDRRGDAGGQDLRLDRDLAQALGLEQAVLIGRDEKPGEQQGGDAGEREPDAITGDEAELGLRAHRRAPCVTPCAKASSLELIVRWLAAAATVSISKFTRPSTTTNWMMPGVASPESVTVSVGAPRTASSAWAVVWPGEPSTNIRWQPALASTAARRRSTMG